MDVAEVVARARAAQSEIAEWDADRVHELTTAVAYAVARKDRAEALARLAVDEAGFGNYDDKVTKIERRVLGVLSDLRETPTVGVVEEDPARGLVKIAKPVGVVAGLVPTTGPDATPPVKALCALAGRNAIVVRGPPAQQAHDRRGRGLHARGVRAGRCSGRPRAGPAGGQDRPHHASSCTRSTSSWPPVAPAWSRPPTAPGRRPSASGSATRSTWSTRPPTSRTRPGRSWPRKTFDYATSCLADNAVVVHESVYDDLLAAAARPRAATSATPTRRPRCRPRCGPTAGEIPTPDVIAKSAPHIAGLAGIDVPASTTFLVVEEDGVGPRPPLQRREALGRARALPLLRRHRQRGRPRSTTSPAIRGSGTPAASTPPTTRTSTHLPSEPRRRGCWSTRISTRAQGARATGSPSP